MDIPIVSFPNLHILTFIFLVVIKADEHPSVMKYADKPDRDEAEFRRKLKIASKQILEPTSKHILLSSTDTDCSCSGIYHSIIPRGGCGRGDGSLQPVGLTVLRWRGPHELILVDMDYAPAWCRDCHSRSRLGSIPRTFRYQAPVSSTLGRSHRSCIQANHYSNLQ